MVNSGKTAFRSIFLASVFLAGLLAGLFLWNRIELPFANPWEIAGELAALQYNPTNNLIRFVVFISLPPALLLGIYLVRSMRLQDLCFKGVHRVRCIDRAIGFSTAKRTMFALSMVTAAVLVGITVTTFGSSGLFDTFHEGETLGPAISFMKGKAPYRDCLFWHGVIQDPLRSVIAFKLFGRSIGAVRAFDSILEILQIIFLAFFMRKIHDGDYLPVALTFIALIAFYNVITLLHVAYLKQIASRDIITVFFLMIIPVLHSCIKQRNFAHGPGKLIIANFLFSFIPVAAFGYSIDRGFYFCATFLVLSPIIYLSFFHRHRFQLHYLASSLSGLLAGLLVLGFLLQGSFSAFFEFAFRVVPRYKDLLDGKVYPIHTLPGLACATLIAANTYWMALQYFRTLQLNNNNLPSSIAAFLEMYLIEFCLLLLSIFIFRTALGRSDLGHVVYNSYLAYILFIYIVIKHYLSQCLHREPLRSLFSRAAVLTIALFSVFCVHRIYSWNLIAHNFPFRVSDSQLIPDHCKATIAFLNDNLKSDDDFFTLTSEGCWYYFIDRPCPTRFPVVGFAATNFYQHEVVEDLKKGRVKFILYRNSNWTSTMFGLSAEVRQPIIVDYIKRHYTFFQTIDDNELWIKVENPGKAAQSPS